MDKIKSMTEFEDKINLTEYVILDFGSPGCAPCKKVPPLLQEVLKETTNINISAYEIDITENMEIAQKFMVMGVPTIIILKDGKELKRFNSLPKKEKIMKAIV